MKAQFWRETNTDLPFNADMDESKEERARRLAAQRQARRKAREQAAGLVFWKRWIHPDDARALEDLAEKLAEARRPVTGS